MLASPQKGKINHSTNGPAVMAQELSCSRTPTSLVMHTDARDTGDTQYLNLNKAGKKKILDPQLNFLKWCRTGLPSLSTRMRGSFLLHVPEIYTHRGTDAAGLTWDNLPRRYNNNDRPVPTTRQLNSEHRTALYLHVKSWTWENSQPIHEYILMKIRRSATQT
jgi:hypothetical protein